MDDGSESSFNEHTEIHLSLQELDPEPAGFYEYDEKSFLPDSPLLPLWSLPFGLSNGNGAGRGSIYYSTTNAAFLVTKLQKYSSYAFTIFASLHVTNTSFIPLLTQSIDESESYLLLTRPFYQSFPAELLFIGLPIAVHVTAGIVLRLYKRNINLLRYGAFCLPISTRLEKRLKVWPHMSWTSLAGYLMIPLVGSHILINRILPWLYEGGSSGIGLGYVAHSFAKHPLLASINYSLMIGLVTSHISWGFCRWKNLIISGDSQKARRRWWTINSVSAALALGWIIGGIGVVGRGGRANGWVGNEYDNILRHLWL